jgi:hypothetical protein
MGNAYFRSHFNIDYQGSKFKYADLINIPCVCKNIFCKFEIYFSENRSGSGVKDATLKHR